jgi:hypothetical protein
VLRKEKGRKRQPKKRREEKRKKVIKKQKEKNSEEKRIEEGLNIRVLHLNTCLSSNRILVFVHHLTTTCFISLIKFLIRCPCMSRCSTRIHSYAALETFNDYAMTVVDCLGAL